MANDKSAGDKLQELMDAIENCTETIGDARAARKIVKEAHQSGLAKGIERGEAIQKKLLDKANSYNSDIAHRRLTEENCWVDFCTLISWIQIVCRPQETEGHES